MPSKIQVTKQIERFMPFVVMACPCSFAILPIKFSNLFIIALIVGWLYLTIANRESFKLRGAHIGIFLMFAYYALLLLGLSYTDNFVMGSKNLETKMALVIFPVVFFCGYDVLTNVDKKSLLLVYANSIFGFCCYVLVKLIISIERSSDDWVSSFYATLNDSINIHPGYLSLYTGFSILILMIYFNSFHWSLKILCGFQIVFLTFFNLLLIARMPLIALGATLLWY